MPVPRASRHCSWEAICTGELKFDASDMSLTTGLSFYVLYAAAIGVLQPERARSRYEYRIVRLTSNNDFQVRG